MPPAQANGSPDRDFFNDLSQRPQGSRTQSQEGEKNGEVLGENEGQPRAKRIACVLCRKRKLRCDGARPKCATCSRLSHECGYDEVRKKSGPKRGYVKHLEQRLQQVETLLKTQDKPDQTSESPDQMDTSGQALFSDTPSAFTIIPNSKAPSDPRQPADPSNKWEMVGLGLEEPMPSQDVINDLHEIYFRQLHLACPMIHKPRYLAALRLPPNMRPAACLRYMIWALAASVSDKYSGLADEFYRRSKKYADLDEMKGHGESIITLGHCQAYVLMTWYEFKHMYFPRAWQDSGRATSLALMMGLNRTDGAGLDVKQCLPPAKDWTEREERRRTFWMCFCADRYASIGTGWALRIDERDIMTLLPSSEEAYEKSRPETAPSLEQAFSITGSSNLSSIAAVTLVATLLGRNLTHLHRPTSEDNEEDLNGAFWRRHRHLETLLANICLALPDHLRIPNGLPDPNVIFMNMLLHTSVICLHQAAIFKADRNRLPQNIISESRARCVTGASEITRIMKMMSHIDLSTLNPFLAFCLYVAARVFVQYLKWRPKDQSMMSALVFLGSAMHILKKKNPLTESFLAQLEVDLEGTGIVIGPRTQTFWHTQDVNCMKEPGGHKGILVDLDSPRAPAEIPVNTDAVKCSPLYEIRDSQGGSVDNSIFHPQMDPNNPGYSTMHAQINLDVDNSFNHMSNNDPMSSFQLPNRNKGSPYNPLLNSVDSSHTPNSSDMDYSGGSNVEKTRSNSYKDSSSHTSFTPPSGADTNNSGARNSPITVESLPTPNVNSIDAMFFDSSSFPSFQGAQMFGTPFGSSADGSMPPSWDFNAPDLATGLTPGPMGEQWNEVLANQSWMQPEATGGYRNNGQGRSN